MNTQSASPWLPEAAKSELIELTTRIAPLTAQMQALNEETLHIHRDIRTLQSRAAQIANEALLISRLPAEVLQIVFHEACRKLAPRLDVRRPLPTEVQLSHVCRRWRAVALGAPKLWTVLSVPVFHSELAAKVYLERCGRCLLTVRLGPKLSGNQTMAVFTSVIIPRISQVQELIVGTQEPKELYTMVRMLKMLKNLAAPHLRRLQIMTRDNLGEQNVGLIFKDGAPLLSDVRLGPIPITLPPAPLSVLHIDLHSGTTTPHPQSYLLNIIRPIPTSLKVLHLTGEVRISQQVPGSRSVVLPALRELVVYGGCNVFQSISAPSLCSLTLHNVKQRALSSIHRFIAFTCPGQFRRLQGLHYINCGADTELNICFLDTTLFLSRLSVTLDQHYTHLMRLLFNSDKQAMLFDTVSVWRHLIMLTIHVTVPWPPEEREESESDEDDVHPTIALLVEVVELREDVESGLDTLRIKGQYARPFYNDLVLALDKAEAEEGVEVEVEVEIVADLSSTETDWADTSHFYGVE